MRLPAPEPSGEHASLILFVGERAWAADLTRAGPKLPALAFREIEQMYALYFGCSLEGLGLLPGWQQRDESGALLPAPIEVLALGEEMEWTPATLPESLKSVRLQTSFRCSSFSITNVHLEGVRGSGGRVLAPLGGDRFLFASHDGIFFEVTREGALRVDTPTTTPHIASFTDASGIVWLLGERGRVVRYDGTLFEDAGLLESESGDSDPGDLGGSNDLPPQLWAATREGLLEHFDGNEWDTLVDDPLDRHDSPGVAIAAGGSAFMIGPRQSTVIHHHLGTIAEEPIAGGTGPLLNSIAFVEGLGAVVGTVTGQHWLRAERWIRLEGSPSANVIRTITPFRGGFLAGGINGFMTQYHPQLGFCEPMQLGTDGITRVAPTSTGFAMTSIHAGDAPDVVTFIDELGGGSSCAR